MASKTIDHLALTVGVTPYEHEGNKYDALRISVMYSKGYGFYVSWIPIEVTECGFKTGCMSSRDPLEGGGKAIVERVTKNNSKRLTEMHAALQLAQEGIALYFDKRLFVQMEDFMRYVALYGYTPHYQQQVESLKAAAEVAPMMKSYNELKQKHPDALLLFRCGDFYETYQDDAKECAKIFGITLTYRCGDKLPMAGFPHHALDTYLPKLVRAGKRVAICDQLEDPKKVAKITNNNNNNETLEDKAMTNNETKNESANVAMQPQVSNHITTEADVAEVNDIVPQVTPKAKPEKPAVTMPLSDHGTLVVGGVPKPKTQGGQSPSAPATPTLTGDSPLAKVAFGTYKTKKGADAPMITGFGGDDDPRWKKLFDAKPKWVSAGYRRDLEGNKTYHLLFGTKYMDVAKALAEAYNTTDKAAWAKAEAACAGNYDGIVSGYKAEREARKAEREAKKSSQQTRTNTDSPQGEKCYTLDEVAAMLGKLLPDGAASTEDIKKLLQAA